MKFVIKLLHYIYFLIKITFGTPFIIGLYTTLAILYGCLAAIFVVVGCSPFIFIFLYLLSNVSTVRIEIIFQNIVLIIGGITYVLSVVIGFGYGVHQSILNIEEQYFEYKKSV